jgi:hypothetical protein
MNSLTHSTKPRRANALVVLVKVRMLYITNLREADKRFCFFSGKEEAGRAKSALELTRGGFWKVVLDVNWGWSKRV